MLKIYILNYFYNVSFKETLWDRPPAAYQVSLLRKNLHVSFVNSNHYFLFDAILRLEIYSIVLVNYLY
jgi:hypothetical protein